ncbi:Protein of unknown function DUF247, partial [Theobroma cacao]
MAFEQCHYPHKAHFCSYIQLLDSLVDTSEDVDLLVKERIIVNRLGSSAAVADMINNLAVGIVHSTTLYGKIGRDLNQYNDNSWNHRWAALKHVYFNNLWRGTATFEGFGNMDVDDVLGSTKYGLLEVEFKKGVLKLLTIDVEYETEIRFRNLMAFEQYYYPKKAYFCSYIKLLDSLVDTNEDVDLLVKEGIIVNRLGSSEAVAKMINKLAVGVVHSTLLYGEIGMDLDQHYKNSWNRRMATLKHEAGVEFKCAAVNDDFGVLFNGVSYNCYKIGGLEYEGVELIDMVMDDMLKCTTYGLLQVRLEKGVLKLFTIDVEYETEIHFRNLMAFEQYYYPKSAYFCSYIKLLDSLIDTSEDVNLLVKEGIIVNRLGSSVAVANMINNLAVGVVHSTLLYGEIGMELGWHYKNSWNRRWATLK